MGTRLGPMMCEAYLQGTVAQFSSQMEKLNGEDDCKSILDRLKGHDDQLTDIKSKEETLRSQLSDLRAKDGAKNADIPQLQQVTPRLSIVTLAFSIGTVRFLCVFVNMTQLWLRLLLYVVCSFQSWDQQTEKTCCAYTPQVYVLDGSKNPLESSRSEPQKFASV